MGRFNEAADPGLEEDQRREARLRPYRLWRDGLHRPSHRRISGDVLSRRRCSVLGTAAAGAVFAYITGSYQNQQNPHRRLTVSRPTRRIRGPRLTAVNLCRLFGRTEPRAAEQDKAAEDLLWN